MSSSDWWFAQRHDNSRVALGRNSWSARQFDVWLDTHQFDQPFYFLDFNSNPTLAAASALKKLNGNRLSANDELADTTTTQPIVQGCGRDAESACGCGSCQEVLGHRYQPE